MNNFFHIACKLHKFILVFLALMSCSFAVNAGPDIKHWETSRGVRVYFVESHELPMVDLQLVFDAGSVRDPDGKLGWRS